jgi:UDP-N-acetylglucosamine 1-carboxyvinyltransferase
MALACMAEGDSYIHERIFNARMTLAEELTKMGARIEVEGNRAVVHGSSELRGAQVVAHDLRTGSALVLAGLAATGEVTITSGYYIDRGHADVTERLTALGADIEREVGS